MNHGHSQLVRAWTHWIINDPAVNQIKNPPLWPKTNICLSTKIRLIRFAKYLKSQHRANKFQQTSFSPQVGGILLQVNFFSSKYKLVAEETFKGQNCNYNKNFCQATGEIWKCNFVKSCRKKNTLKESSNLCFSSLCYCWLTEHHTF